MVLALGADERLQRLPVRLGELAPQDRDSSPSSSVRRRSSSQRSTIAQASLVGSMTTKWSPSTACSSASSPAVRAAATKSSLWLNGTFVSARPWTHSTGHAEREPLDRAGVVVALRDLGRVTAEEGLGRAGAELVECGAPKVEDAGLGHDAGDRHRRIAPGRRPRRQVAAGRVADRDDAAQVERRVDVGEGVDRRGHVVERRRVPTAAADAAVLDVQRRPATCRQRRRQRSAERQVEALPPEATVDDDGDGRLLPAGRHRQLGELRRVVAVADDLRAPRRLGPDRAGPSDVDRTRRPTRRSRARLRRGGRVDCAPTSSSRRYDGGPCLPSARDAGDGPARTSAGTAAVAPGHAAHATGAGPGTAGRRAPVGQARRPHGPRRRREQGPQAGVPLWRRAAQRRPLAGHRRCRAVEPLPDDRRRGRRARPRGPPRALRIAAAAGDGQPAARRAVRCPTAPRRLPAEPLG